MAPAANHIFLFLEIFSGEGGIQSYVKDILHAYQLAVSEFSPPRDRSSKAEVLLLRDTPDSDNPFASNTDVFAFRYLKTLPPWLGRVRLASLLLLFLLRRRPQRVFCGHVNLAPMTQLFCQSLGIPYTVLTYGKEVWDPLPPRYVEALQKAHSIWCISRHSRDRACEVNHLDPRQFRMVSCVVDGDTFTPGEKPPELIERYGLYDAKVLMTVARLWSGDIYKGVDVTIRALGKVAAVFPDVKYLVIGRGDDQPRLAQLAEDLGVRDRVIFAGFVPTEELPDHYRVADGYVMPSREGFGIVYLEAMACGVPVISGDADGSADPLQDGRVGWQVPYRDPEAVAAACIELLGGEDQRCQGEWLRSQTLAKFSKNALTQKIQTLLQEG